MSWTHSCHRDFTKFWAETYFLPPGPLPPDRTDDKRRPVADGVLTSDGFWMRSEGAVLLERAVPPDTVSKWAERSRVAPEAWDTTKVPRDGHIHPIQAISGRSSPLFVTAPAAALVDAWPLLLTDSDTALLAGLTTLVRGAAEFSCVLRLQDVGVMELRCDVPWQFPPWHRGLRPLFQMDTMDDADRQQLATPGCMVTAYLPVHRTPIEYVPGSHREPKAGERRRYNRVTCEPGDMLIVTGNVLRRLGPPTKNDSGCAIHQVLYATWTAPWLVA